MTLSIPCLSSSNDRTARIWDVSTAAVGLSSSSQNHTDKVLACLWTSQGHVLTASQDKSAKVRGSMIKFFFSPGWDAFM